ncbi:hypothetical protein RM533_03715 [Croceicoccus sp. F390]|uniref:Uncharacterized protein n=1 Tax=Croceicoccus esteveae TaxID=3075597 RepID=A0ABU2ZFB0_9SPHN|nr:hypothetical protein [Croceicoccus sp. F390]MDT0575287.1 hypothetical protein [Croceicoccus sp. F390]
MSVDDFGITAEQGVIGLALPSNSHHFFSFIRNALAIALLIVGAPFASVGIGVHAYGKLPPAAPVNRSAARPTGRCIKWCCTRRDRRGRLLPRTGCSTILQTR